VREFLGTVQQTEALTISGAARSDFETGFIAGINKYLYAHNNQGSACTGLYLLLIQRCARQRKGSPQAGISVDYSVQSITLGPNKKARVGQT
jgi:hypothetical protein